MNKPKINTRAITDRMSASLGKTRAEKLEKARAEIVQADKVIERVVPIIDGDSPERREAAKDLRGLTSILQDAARIIQEAARDTNELAEFTEQQNQLIDVAMGEFKEAGDILKSAAEKVEKAGHDLQHQETFLNAFDEYLRGDPRTIAQALELMDPALMRQELIKLDRQRFKALEYAIEAAAIDRVTTGKDTIGDE